MTETTADFVDRMAHFAVATRFEDIPEAALVHLRTIFADTLAVIAAGMQQPEMGSFARSQVAEVAGGRASVVGTGLRCNPMDAAALNAAAGVWLELDEGNLQSRGHPGIHSLPTAFALVQQYGRSGVDMLTAAAVGYELCGRIAGAAAMRVIVQPHGTWGVIGAAVAAGRLRGFDVPAMRRVIDIAAATPLGGNRRTMQTGATVRNWYAGHSHIMGQTAVRLTEAGFTAPADAIQTTFGQVLSDGFDAERACAGLGERWWLADGYIKLYPGARHLHRAIDALRDLLDKVPGGRLDPRRIRKIDVAAHKLGAFCASKQVDNAFAALFSIPFALAAVIVRGGWRIECFGAQALDDPSVHALCQRVDVIEDPRYTQAPSERQPCDVTVTMDDGTQWRGHCEVMRGEPNNPNDPAEFRRKYLDLAGPVWGSALSERVYSDCMRLDKIADLRTFAEGAAL